MILINENPRNNQSHNAKITITKKKAKGKGIIQRLPLILESLANRKDAI